MGLGVYLKASMASPLEFEGNYILWGFFGNIINRNYILLGKAILLQSKTKYVSYGFISYNCDFRSHSWSFISHNCDFYISHCDLTTHNASLFHILYFISHLSVIFYSEIETRLHKRNCIEGNTQ